MVKQKKSNFRGRVASNAAKTQKAGITFGYLNLPKGVSMFSPEPGDSYKLNFLPYIVTDPKHPDVLLGTIKVGDQWYKRPFKIHRNIGPNSEAVVCPTSIGKKCFICEHRAKKIKEGGDKEEIQQMKPSLRELYIVQPLDSKKHEAEIHLFEFSHYNFQDMLTDELKENEDHEIFPDLNEGETLKIRFASKTIGNSQPFAQASRIDFLDRKEQYDEEILEEVPNLDDMLIVLSYEELKAKFLEMEDEEDAGELSDEDDEEDEKPAKKTSKKKVVDDEEEDEEEEKPTRSKKPSRKVKDEEEDEDTDEEEDEEPIRKKKTLSKKSTKVEEEETDDEEEDEEPKSKTKGTKPKCPAGGTFGEDFEEFKKCADCKLWDDCSDASDN